MPRKLQIGLLLPALLLSAAMASAQGHGGGGHGGPGGGGAPMNHIGPSNSFIPHNSIPHRPATNAPAPHSMVQVGPPGRWWDDKSFARSIGIADDQRKRMDTIFNDNKGLLAESYNRLQHEENALNKLVKAKHPDEEKIIAQIDQVAQARADLEKNTTRVLLALRRELNDDQWAKLETRTHEMQQAPPPGDQPQPIDQP